MSVQDPRVPNSRSEPQTLEAKGNGRPKWGARTFDSKSQTRSCDFVETKRAKLSTVSGIQRASSNIKTALLFASWLAGSRYLLKQRKEKNRETEEKLHWKACRTHIVRDPYSDRCPIPFLWFEYKFNVAGAEMLSSLWHCTNLPVATWSTWLLLHETFGLIPPNISSNIPASEYGVHQQSLRARNERALR